MSKPHPPDFFSKEASLSYDEKNRKLAPIAECLHFLIRLLLKELPPHARVLCVGVGTGAEILSLAQAFPEATFVGVDPSASMLEVCRERLRAAGILHRCELRQGYVQDVPVDPAFDAALSVLVAHFVPRAERLGFFRAMSQRVRADGFLVNAEISFDLDSPEFPAMLKNWQEVQSLMGGTPESLAALPHVLRNVLCVLPPSETEGLLRQSGVSQPIRFFQAFMICGWYGKNT